jgi:hypothetical protein
MTISRHLRSQTGDGRRAGKARAVFLMEREGKSVLSFCLKALDQAVAKS